VGDYIELFVGLDVSKLKISVAVAMAGREGEVRFYGDISSSPAVVAAMIKKLAKPGVRLNFCYEAGPTGYELHRQIIEAGHACAVVAPSSPPNDTRMAEVATPFHTSVACWIWPRTELNVSVCE